MPSDLHPKVESDLRQLINLAQAGTLKTAEFYRLAELEVREWGTHYRNFDPEYYLSRARMRARFIQEVSYAVFTEEYLNSLGDLLRGRRVLEVCARTGVLGPLMRARGVTWTCTDIDSYAEGVEEIEALEALDKYNPEVVFASWIPLGDSLDQDLASRVPCVFVLESCTGSVDNRNGFFYQDSFSTEEVPEGFEDVPNWSGIRDRTVLTFPVSP